MTQALILVDLQIDYLEFGMRPIPNIRSIIAKINGQIETYDLVLATQNWYPATHVRFAANHPWRKPGGSVTINEQEQALYELHCVQNTFGSGLIPDLNTDSIEQIFHKGSNEQIDSQHLFYDADDKHSTGLLEFLRARGIEEILLAGVNVDGCFEKTIEASKHLNMNVVVLNELSTNEDT